MNSLAAAAKVAEERGKQLFANDFHTDLLVRVVEQEGTILEFAYAFYETWNEWVFVFSEHHPIYIQHIEEIVYVRQLKIVSSVYGNGGFGKTEGDWK